MEKLYAIINFIICWPISYWWWNFAKKSIFIVEHKRALHRKATLDRNQTQSTHVEVIGVENPKTTLFHRFDDKATNPHSLSNGNVQPCFDEGHGEERLTIDQLSLLTSTHSKLTAEQMTRVKGSTTSAFEFNSLNFLKYKIFVSPLIPCKPPEKTDN
jgi:hypothetical protein